MGNHTTHKDAETLSRLTESIVENRDLFIELCAANGPKVTNTQFRKPLDKTATYRMPEQVYTNVQQ